MTVKWHPYPKEKPQKKGKYLVTLATDIFSRDRYVDIWTWGDGYFYKNGWMVIPETHVIAWTELPIEYQGDVDEIEFI